MIQRKQYLRTVVFVGLIAGLIGACSPTSAPNVATNSATTSPAPAAATSSTAANDSEQARTSLIRYFSALHGKHYDEAARLYGGSYQLLTSYNPAVAPDNHSKLFEHACTANGFQCLEIEEIVQVEEVSPTEFKFTVEFKQADGALFRMTDPQTGQPITQWPYTVKKVHDAFLVQELPVYTP
jgi:hypothetical protein